MDSDDDRPLLLSAETCTDAEVTAARCSAKNFTLEHTRQFLGDELGNQLTDAIDELLEESPDLELPGDTGRGKTTEEEKVKLCRELTLLLYEYFPEIGEELLKVPRKVHRNQWVAYQTAMRLRRDRKGKRRAQARRSGGNELAVANVGGGAAAGSGVVTRSSTASRFPVIVPIMAPQAGLVAASSSTAAQPRASGRTADVNRRYQFVPVGVIYRREVIGGTGHAGEDLVVGCVEDAARDMTLGRGLQTRAFVQETSIDVHPPSPGREISLHRQLRWMS
ncbi:hypothetical protein ABW21_db0205968 [Orbilia brochopaga]|nr:hypothetical protein ABW21_db0205968 [Drechslerella brochopaga]